MPGYLECVGTKAADLFMHEQHDVPVVGLFPPKEQLESTRWITLLFQFQFHLNPPPCAVQILNISGLCVRCGKRDAGEDRGGGASDGNSTTEECAVLRRSRTCHTSGKCYSALGGRCMGTQVATSRRGGRAALSICILLHSPVLRVPRLGDRASRFVYHCCSVFRSVAR